MSGSMSAANRRLGDDEMLEHLQRQTYEYFSTETCAANGLVRDKTEPGSPASIAVVGFALTSYPVAVERGFLARASAATATLATLRFFERSPQGEEPDATGYRGFFYHFLDMRTGRRAWKCELSTIDTAIFIAGALAASAYFDRDTEAEAEIRELASTLYERIDWVWAQDGGATLTHGWRPETGFIPYRWVGYSEALILYALGLGSPTHPLPEESFTAWTRTYDWREIYGKECLYAGPLFIHQFSHIWIDFRAIQDPFMLAHGIDYFENSRRATYIQQEYAVRNPLGFAHYGERLWGFTASDGPGPSVVSVGGVDRTFWGYLARGAPFGPDDGTISPWAVVASLPFAPEIVLPTIRHAIEKLELKELETRGFDASFNGTHPPTADNPHGWVSPWRFGINEGPTVLMIENFRSELVWRLMKKSPSLVRGLRRAGFRGGWLSKGTE
jgi:hypothetical protein